MLVGALDSVNWKHEKLSLANCLNCNRTKSRNKKLMGTKFEKDIWISDELLLSYLPGEESWLAAAVYFLPLTDYVILVEL